jgi:hypothetical protein
MIPPAPPRPGTGCAGGYETIVGCWEVEKPTHLIFPGVGKVIAL